MVDLLEELGVPDDEHYIYLDNGIPKQRIEITVHWNHMQNKKILVTVNMKDSLSYLRYRIAEVLEKYNIFEGLTDLKAVNLATPKVTLPKVIYIQKGIIETCIKNGDHLHFDVTSLDLWIYVQINCRDAKLVIKFEIKVMQSLMIEQLKKTLVDIGNRVIKANHLEIRYEEHEVSILKAITPSDRLSKDTLRLERQNADPLRDDQQVTHYFDYINRYAICELFHCESGLTPICRSNSRRYSQISLFFMIDLFNSCPIRGLKIESMPIYDFSLDSPRKLSKLGHLPNSKSSCCQECSVM